MKTPKTTHSKLLIPEQPLQVLPALAMALGLNEAIILQQLHYWLGKTTHARDGEEWIYNTYEDWRKQFPFWSISTIKRAMLHLEKEEVVVTANYNNSNIDKTKWYRINYNKLNSLCDSPMAQDDTSTCQNEPSTDHNDTTMAQNGPSTCQNEPSIVSNCPHQFPETNTETTDREEIHSPVASPSLPQEYHGSNGIPPRPQYGDGAAAVTPKLLMEWYNAETPPNHRKIKSLSPERIKNAKRRAVSFPDPAFWHAMFAEVGKSALLLGNAQSPGHENFLGDFDWLLAKGKDGVENCLKVYEGKYRDKELTPGQRPKLEVYL